MSKSLAASKQLMQTYLSELLTEEEEQKALLVKVKQTEPLERLLASATFPKTVEQETAEPIRSAKAENKTLVATQLEIDTPVKTTVKPVVKAKPAKINTKVIDKKVLSSSREVQLNELKTRKSAGGFEAINQRSYRQGDFQAMFFDVAGLMIAVPYS